jgi:isopenicillin N synthase-like dioxygenase
LVSGNNSPGTSVIPLIDAGPLFDSNPSAWVVPDRELFAAARDTGFVCITGLPADIPLEPATRARLLSIFGLSAAEKYSLCRRKFAPENRNIYRGWFPLQPGNLTFKEGIDIGNDVAYGQSAVAGDPLREPTPLPEDVRLPGWREFVAIYFRAMERVAETLMRSLSRSLGLPGDYFDDAFHRGLSTLRLIHYPSRNAADLAAVTDPAVWVEPRATGRHIVGAAHTDSGFITLLAQDGVSGLQARSVDGRWIEVPPLEGTVVVNFGQVLEQWSAGRIRATEHRVLGKGVERNSIPFFYEARADATIAPLPIDPPDRFAPFKYGDFLWKRITSFVEFRGMEQERACDPQVSLGSTAPEPGGL